MKKISPPRKYQQLEAEIRQFALSLPIGAKLPAERELADSYNCNFLTIRRALKQMVDDGTIVRRIGSGTFVARHPVEANGADKARVAGVGVLVFQGSNAYAYRVLQAMANASVAQNVDLRSIWVQDLGDEVQAQVELLRQGGCTALVLPWFPHERGAEVRRFLQNSPLPASLPLIIPGLEKNCFEHPDVFGASIITEDIFRYFRLLGHNRIALLGPDSADDYILQKRISSYIHYTSREGLDSICGLVEPGAQAMDHLAERWKAHQGNLAIVCYDDEHALRFMTAMHKIGLQAPRDFAIIGYNDTEGSRYSDPPLSTVHQDFDYIGHGLLKSALALGQGSISQSTEIPRLQLLVRETCGGQDKINDSFRHKLRHTDINVGRTSAKSADATNGT